MTWRGRNIYLVGLPGAGKTAIGKSLSRLIGKSGYRFLDLDEVVETHAGKRVGEIFSKSGESQFRKLESEQLLQASERAFSRTPLVVATGGGTVVRPVNRAIMRGSGIVVWIDVSVKAAARQVLQSILEGNSRPLLRASTPEELTGKLRSLHEERLPYYEQSQLHFVVKSPKGSERTPDELADELYQALEQMSRHITLRPRFITLSAKSALGDYSVLVGSGIAQSEITHAINDIKATHVVLLTDKNVSRLHVGRLLQKFSPDLKARIKLHQITLDPGESSKSYDTLMEVLTSMMKLDVPRRGGMMITMGGGVVSDIGGLVANLYKRGIPVMHVPTTLLAQADAAIGGKTGIDHDGGKNALGTFYPPKRVLVDPIFLKTLEKRELHAGLGEVFKYALIGSKPMWQILAKSVRRLTRGVDASYESLIRDSIREKLRVVQRDEFERHEGVREILNFGHTFAHALESATKFETFLHGEAVLLGMRAASWLSMKLEMIDEATWREIEIVLGRIPIAASTALQVRDVLPHFMSDKKRSSEGHRLVLLRSIGEATIVNKVPEGLLEEAVQFMLTLI